MRHLHGQFFTDRAGEIDLQLLPHVQFGELSLAAALILSFVVVVVHRLAGKRDRLAAGDLDVGALAEDPPQRFWKTDRNIDVEVFTAPSGAAALLQFPVVLKKNRVVRGTDQSVNIDVQRHDHRIDKIDPVTGELDHHSFCDRVDPYLPLPRLYRTAQEWNVVGTVESGIRVIEETRTIPVGRRHLQVDRARAEDIGIKLRGSGCRQKEEQSEARSSN